MKHLNEICESILGDIESGVEGAVELLDRMRNDLAWVRKIKADEAVYSAYKHDLTKEKALAI